MFIFVTLFIVFFYRELTCSFHNICCFIISLSITFFIIIILNVMFYAPWKNLRALRRLVHLYILVYIILEIKMLRVRYVQNKNTTFNKSLKLRLPQIYIFVTMLIRQSFTNIQYTIDYI